MSTNQPWRLSEQIVLQLERQISSGQLQPGDKLPSERELSEEFEVSRTAVREAINSLRDKGLVIVQPGRGTFLVDNVAEAAQQSFEVLMQFTGGANLNRDLMEIREILEPEIAAIAAVGATETQISEMHRIVHLMDEYLLDVNNYIQADHAFHNLLAHSTQNKLIPVLIEPIVGLLHEQRRGIFSVEGGPQRGQKHHKEILRSVEDRKPELARIAMQAHLRQIRKDSGT